MEAGSFQQWSLIVAAACLCGWYLSLRSGASMTAISSSVSFLIILMAGLLVMLAVNGQGEPRACAAGAAPRGPAAGQVHTFAVRSTTQRY